MKTSTIVIISIIVVIVILIAVYFYYRYSSSQSQLNLLNNMAGVWNLKVSTTDKVPSYLLIQQVPNSNAILNEWVPGPVQSPSNVLSQDNNSITVKATSPDPPYNAYIAKYVYNNQNNTLTYSVPALGSSGISLPPVSIINVTDPAFDNNLLKFNGTWVDKTHATTTINLVNSVIININNYLYPISYAGNILTYYPKQRSIGGKTNVTFPTITYNSNNNTISMTDVNGVVNVQTRKN